MDESAAGGGQRKTKKERQKETEKERYRKERDTDRDRTRRRRVCGGQLLARAIQTVSFTLFTSHSLSLLNFLRVGTNREWHGTSQPWRHGRGTAGRKTITKNS